MELNSRGASSMVGLIFYERVSTLFLAQFWETFPNRSLLEESCIYLLSSDLAVLSIWAPTHLLSGIVRIWPPFLYLSSVSLIY
jgi:hypothetical protein